LVYVSTGALELEREGPQILVAVFAHTDPLEFATDLKELYPEKEITLLHSCERLMPLYPESMHNAGMCFVGPYQPTAIRADDQSWRA
jgi:hypothetical protein